MKYDFDHTLDHRKDDSIRWKQPEGRDDILGMGTADLDFFCAPCIREATQKVCDENTFNYRLKPRQYHDGIVQWFKNRYQMNIEGDCIRELPSTVGSIRLTIGAFCRPGDYILMQTPCFTPLKAAIEGAGCRFLDNPMILQNGRYELDFDDFEEKIKKFHPSMFLLVSPQNPTGRVFTKAELEKMVDICEKYHVLILSDEVHFLITYDGHVHTPILNVNAKARDISIQVFSFSKGFNLMGLPHAMLLMPNPEIRRRWDSYLTPFDFHYVTNAFSMAAVTALASGKGDEWLDEATEYLRGNRDAFIKAIQEKGLPIKPLIPEASFLFWIDCRETDLDPEKLGEIFMERARISLNNGLEHGPEGRGFVRLNFGVTRAVLDLAVDRIEKMFR